ncbi:hypothetical protein AB4Y95_18535 [Arthrobacter sp. M-10]|uniref:hypothetical protein n=1 Tax=Arthrobacter sp. M-10 TaxID=3233037 RepID=UPI003F93EA34
MGVEAVELQNAPADLQNAALRVTAAEPAQGFVKVHRHSVKGRLEVERERLGFCLPIGVSFADRLEHVRRRS